MHTLKFLIQSFSLIQPAHSAQLNFHISQLYIVVIWVWKELNTMKKQLRVKNLTSSLSLSQRNKFRTKNGICQRTFFFSQPSLNEHLLQILLIRTTWHCTNVLFLLPDARRNDTKLCWMIHLQKTKRSTRNVRNVEILNFLSLSMSRIWVFFDSRGFMSNFHVSSCWVHSTTIQNPRTCVIKPNENSLYSGSLHQPKLNFVWNLTNQHFLVFYQLLLLNTSSDVKRFGIINAAHITHIILFIKTPFLRTQCALP